MTDQTFITNQKGETLQKRFASLIKDSVFFDVLSGYFYTSGFKAIYSSLKNTKKIRILIGISTDFRTYQTIKNINLSHNEVSNLFSASVQKELEDAEDSFDTEESIKKFKDWIKEGRLEIKVYPDEKVHSKLYIMTFEKNDRDKGRVITGSSNFTQSGLNSNIEFNVELKSPYDYEYALSRFNELWEKAISVNEKYVQTIENDTWLNDKLTPYELYLKFLYEYFINEINNEEDLSHQYRPEGFKKLQYQEDAVINAKRIINEYGGVFISDVVGLGKTYMGTMLCQELGGSTLIIAPPHLIDEKNPGSWINAFKDFGFRAKDFECKSKGVIDQIAQREEYTRFDNIIIDEAHNYRNEDTSTYTELSKICKNKRVILVTATPYNNYEKDLLSQIKLFQPVRNSTIPNLKNIEGFFNKIRSSLKGLNRIDDPVRYINQIKDNAKMMREKLLKYLMVRRTRQEIQEFYGEDLLAQNLKFPEIADPRAIFYQFDNYENKIFDETLITLTRNFNFARYRPLDYLLNDKKLQNIDKIRQSNLAKFMKILIVKRLESSYFAFKKTIDRFIKSYDDFIDQFESGSIYISKKYFQKIIELLERNEIEEIDEIRDRGDAELYSSKDFKKSFYDDLISDRDKLIKIKDDWKEIKSDSKLKQFLILLKTDQNLINSKKIIFTESSETCSYLKEELNKIYPDKVLNFSGGLSNKDREMVLNNFDNNAKIKSDNFDILITTDVLAEGVNLHRSNVIINYDLPWNPTRIMQRVGRINRVDTPHDVLHTYNFFPTQQSDDEIGLKQNAEAKINAFISLLGVDAKLLTDNEEIEAHSLFDKLNTKKSILEDGLEIESEFGYLKEIRKIRDEEEDLFVKIKKLPKKSRTSRSNSNKGLITYLRKGGLNKFFYTSIIDKNTVEKSFIEAANMLRALPNETAKKFNKNYYELLYLNKLALDKAILEEEEEISKPTGGSSNINKLRKLLSSSNIRYNPKYTEGQEEYVNKILKEIDNGSLSKGRAKEALDKISKPELLMDPIKFINRLKSIIPETEITKKNKETSSESHKKEVILSEFYT